MMLFERDKVQLHGDPASSWGVGQRRAEDHWGKGERPGGGTKTNMSEEPAGKRIRECVTERAQGM